MTVIPVRGQADAPPTGLAALDQGAVCGPSWLPTFGQQPGTNDRVRAMTVFDDGTGPALFVAGDFTTAGGVQAAHVAKWDGLTWTALGDGVDGRAFALWAFDDGSGPALYVGGDFALAGGVPANHVARWDGTAWSALGAGVGDVVNALTSLDDGSGPALYAGGKFLVAGGVPASRIAKWSGSTWTALGAGADGPVSVLTAFDDGSGPALYAGGSFPLSDGTTASGIAKWNGADWSGLGAGGAVSITSMTVFDDGSGPALHAGGSFGMAGGAVGSVAKWNGSTWLALGNGMNGKVLALTGFHDGSSTALYAAGKFGVAGGVPVKSIARWDGAAWAPLGSGLGELDHEVAALAVFPSGMEPALVAGGTIDSAGETPVLRVAAWSGAEWSALGQGVVSGVHALLAGFDDGSGPALYAGGFFIANGSTPLHGVARWSNSGWSPLGNGLKPYSVVNALAGFDDGTGAALFAAGAISNAGGLPANRIAKWDGTDWAALGTGLGSGNYGDGVFALTAFDDGSGPALYAAGSFTLAGGVSARSIARWDGSQWSALGAGLESGVPLPPGSVVVAALAGFDDGSGSALYAGGQFTASGGWPLNAVARWDGAAWSALGEGIAGSVTALAVFDDGSGPALIVGGTFSSAGGVPANNIARWDGSHWSALGSGTDGGVLSLVAFDDGMGQALYAGGIFTTAGGTSAQRIARWDGAVWSALGNGMSGGSVAALAGFDDGTRPTLFAGGSFGSAVDSLDSSLATWGGCPVPASAWTSLGHALPGAVGAPKLLGTGTLESGTAATLNLTHAAPLAPVFRFVSTTTQPLPFKGGTLVPVPPLLAIPFMTSASGDAPFSVTAWPAAVTAVRFYVQDAILDPGAILGVALSNALRADVP